MARSTSAGERRKSVGDHLSNFSDSSRMAASFRSSTWARMDSTVSRTLASAAFIAPASIPRFKYRAMVYPPAAARQARRLRTSMCRGLPASKHGADAAARVGHVAGIARDKMNVNVHARLAARGSDVNADIVAARPALLGDDSLRAIEKRKNGR